MFNQDKQTISEEISKLVVELQNIDVQLHRYHGSKTYADDQWRDRQLGNNKISKTKKLNTARKVMANIEFVEITLMQKKERIISGYLNSRDKIISNYVKSKEIQLEDERKQNIRDDKLELSEVKERLNLSQEAHKNTEKDISSANPSPVIWEISMLFHKTKLHIHKSTINSLQKRLAYLEQDLSELNNKTTKLSHDDILKLDNDSTLISKAKFYLIFNGNEDVGWFSRIDTLNDKYTSILGELRNNKLIPASDEIFLTNEHWAVK